MNNPFIGSGVALVTPFLENDQIDFEALRKLTRYQIDNGTNFLVVQGTTGESPVLTAEEKKQVLQTVIDENKGKLKIVFGVGGNNTQAIGEMLKNLPAGVDGILSVSPYYNKPTQKGIIAHFKYLASCTELPIILYNVPGRTGSNMAASTTIELANIPNIVAVKEASGNMEQIMEIIANRPEGFGVLSGDDNLTLPLIAAGADGVISVVANAFPKLFSEMVTSARHADFEKSRKAHYDLFFITKMFFEEGNPGGVKASLAHQKLMHEKMRMPLFPISDELRSKINKETSRILAL